MWQCSQLSWHTRDAYLQQQIIFGISNDKNEDQNVSIWFLDSNGQFVGHIQNFWVPRAKVVWMATDLVPKQAESVLLRTWFDEKSCAIRFRIPRREFVNLTQFSCE